MTGRRKELPPTRRGYAVDEVVSALQKSIRRSDPDAALYWATELGQSGHLAWLWKRLRVVSSEDCAPGSGVVAEVEALHGRYRERIKSGSTDLGLFWAMHAAVLCATAPKSRISDWAFAYHTSDHVERREIPDEALDMHTRRGRQRGRGKAHFIAEASRLEPFTGSIGRLEEEYRHLVAEPDEDTINPWGPASRETEQMALTEDER
jgi:replication-associated recombination protein RarA